MSEFKPSSVFIPESLASICVNRSQRQVWKEEEMEGEEREEMVITVNNLLSLYCMVGTLLIATHSLSHLIIVTALKERCFTSLYFKDGKMKLSSIWSGKQANKWK